MPSLSVAAAPASEDDGVVLDLAALEAATLERDPFDFVIVPDFVRPAALVAANRDFPKIDGPGNLPPEGLDYGPGFQQLLDHLNDRPFAESMGAKFGLDIADNAKTITVRAFSEASDGNIHTDHRSKIITVLIYFNSQWQQDGGQLRLLRSKRDIEDYAVEVPPMGGTLLAFKRDDHSYHGHKRFVGERRMLQMSWLHPSRAAQYKQRFDRFCTRVIKRLQRLA